MSVVDLSLTTHQWLWKAGFCSAGLGARFTASVLKIATWVSAVTVVELTKNTVPFFLIFLDFAERILHSKPSLRDSQHLTLPLRPY